MEKAASIEEIVLFCMQQMSSEQLLWFVLSKCFNSLILQLYLVTI